MHNEDLELSPSGPRLASVWMDFRASQTSISVICLFNNLRPLALTISLALITGLKRKRNQPLPVNAETPMFGSFKVTESDDKEREQKPGWAPLHDNYMLVDSKFKDWNEMLDSDAGGYDVHMESSSDDD